MIKKSFMLLVLAVIYSLNIVSVYPENLSEDVKNPSNDQKYSLTGDVLYKSGSCGKIKIYDNVSAFSVDGDKFYYIRNSGDKHIAGFFMENQNTGKEFELPVKYNKLYKFIGSNNIFYLLVQSEQAASDVINESGPVLIRYNPDKDNYQTINGVGDFRIHDGIPLLIKNNQLDYNGLLIPLLNSGKLNISDILDSRIAVISGAEGTEIVDLLAGKSIYQYKENSVPEYPDEFNVILEFEDKISVTGLNNGSESIIYYEIFTDGVEENRTETGRGELSRVFYSKLAPGKYHILKPERWELDKTKGRYTRMNNIYQPAELKIYVPVNRIIKIKIEFDGKGYNIIQTMLYK